MRSFEPRANPTSDCCTRLARSVALAATLSVLLAPSSIASQRGEHSVRSSLFVENRGQWPPNVRFAAQVAGAIVRIECGAIGIQRSDADGRGSYVRLAFANAADVEPVGVELGPGSFNYYVGRDPGHWGVGARAYERVAFTSLYPGVDLVVRTSANAFEYDIHLARHVDPGVVVARWEGITAVDSTSDCLTALDASGTLAELPALAWDELPDGRHVDVCARWVPVGAQAFRLDVPGHDPACALIVDPEITWSTYLGSTGGDDLLGAAVDADGNSYVHGITTALDFPQTPGAFHAPVPSALPYWCTAAKFGPDGGLVFSAIFGGSQVQQGQGIAVGADETCMIAGFTTSSDFPTTSSAFDSTLDSGRSAFVVSLGRMGQLNFSTLLEGGTVSVSTATDVAVKANGDCVIGGGTTVFGSQPQLFPTTLPPFGAIDGSCAFLLELSADGASIIWSRFLCGSAGISRLCLTRDEAILCTGQTSGANMHNVPTTPGAFQQTLTTYSVTTVFAARVRGDGSALDWCTYLGGNTYTAHDVAERIATDDFGTATIYGGTESPTFPTTPTSIQPFPPTAGSVSSGFLTRLAADGSHLIYSTYARFDTSGGDIYYPFVNASGLPTLLGDLANLFPATPGANDDTYGPGAQEQVVRLDPHGSHFLHITHVGGPGSCILRGLAEASDGRVLIAGTAYGAFATTPGAFQAQYVGGTGDGCVASFTLDIVGAERVGRSTPACHGAIRAEPLRKLSAHATDFGLYCSCAPPNSKGVLLIGSASPMGHMWGGARVHVASSPRPRFIRVHTDEFGFVEVPLPTQSLTSGRVFAAQFLFLNDRECRGSTRLSASEALNLTVQ